jgi:hypothetical protein
LKRSMRSSLARRDEERRNKEVMRQGKRRREILLAKGARR